MEALRVGIACQMLQYGADVQGFIQTRPRDCEVRRGGFAWSIFWDERANSWTRATSSTGGTLTDSFPSPQERTGWMVSHCACPTREVLDRALRKHRRSISPHPLSSLRWIRRHEHKNFETLRGMILHTMLFTSRRHGPLPWTQHLFL